MKKKIFKYSRIIHRNLSYFFAGIILIYAMSGLAMNHLKDFNPKYTINQREYIVEGSYPHKINSFNKEQITSLLSEINEQENYARHYYPNNNTLKIFMKDGSSLSLDLRNGNATYESIKKRFFFSQITSLHYNPNRWWTIFSDIFAISLIIITISGAIIVRGKNGFIGKGGLLFIAGILVPILFLLFS